jgi:hypothetical protein
MCRTRTCRCRAFHLHVLDRLPRGRRLVRFRRPRTVRISRCANDLIPCWCCNEVPATFQRRFLLYRQRETASTTDQGSLNRATPRKDGKLYIALSAIESTLQRHCARW